ncbi:Vps62-related protein [Chitinophaga ginsengisoli]|uniref:Uncharacterized protein DUF946 n=1 Tax=Chitinophaga ginsengisoli TaxID=363837 RepID=A0A2P8G543_9BACT|nr:Vps62-related protein [Chitinophaga ginsengisoli]PSL29005.1 uncharacterized protein DUF946 [Chitinophaga ginsengisoli]
MEPITSTSGTKFKIRSKRNNGAIADDDAPYLLLEFAGGTGSAYSFSQIWNDLGSDAEYDVSIYRLQSVPDGYFMIGDYAQNNYSAVTGYSPIVSPVNDDPNDPILAAPTGYVFMWSTDGSDTDTTGSIWMPQAPVGYVAMGWVAQLGDSPITPPNISEYRCVRADFVELVQSAPTLIWDDHHSDAYKSIALYTPPNGSGFETQLQGIFVGQPNYDTFDGLIYVFNSRVEYNQQSQS